MSSASSSSATAFANAVAPPAQQTVHHDTLWLQVLTSLEPHIPRGEFITWFRETAVLGREGDTLIIGLPIPMALNWHMEHYQQRTLDAVRSIDPTIGTIIYKIDGQLKDGPAKGVDLLQHFPDQRKRKLPGRQEVRLPEGLTSKVLSDRYTLESFVVGSNNRLAHAACQAVAESPGGKYNPLFLYGGVGLGKTHLLQATGNAILKRSHRATILYTTAEDFTNEVVEAIRMQKMDKVRHRYRCVDVLIIDDVQFLTNKERTQEEFFHTFNTLYEERKQIIISADRPPQELDLEDRLISRFARGMIADVSQPDYETRLAILMEKAAEYELFLDRKVLEYIAEHVTRNVRELEGTLMQAVAQYELEQCMPTVQSMGGILGKLRGEEKEDDGVGFEKSKRQATLQETLEAVSRYYSVSVQDMMGESRVREILLPRQITMHLAKKYINMSYENIGSAFGNRDHTTVMNAVKKIQQHMDADTQLLREVHAIEKELGFVK